MFFGAEAGEESLIAIRNVVYSAISPVMLGRLISLMSLVRRGTVGRESGAVSVFCLGRASVYVILC